MAKQFQSEINKNLKTLQEQINAQVKDFFLEDVSVNKDKEWKETFYKNKNEQFKSFLDRIEDKLNGIAEYNKITVYDEQSDLQISELFKSFVKRIRKIESLKAFSEETITSITVERLQDEDYIIYAITDISLTNIHKEAYLIEEEKSAISTFVKKNTTNNNDEEFLKDFLEKTVISLKNNNISSRTLSSVLRINSKIAEKSNIKVLCDFLSKKTNKEWKERKQAKTQYSNILYYLWATYQESENKDTKGFFNIKNSKELRDWIIKYDSNFEINDNEYTKHSILEINFDKITSIENKCDWISTQLNKYINTRKDNISDIKKKIYLTNEKLTDKEFGRLKSSGKKFGGIELSKVVSKEEFEKLREKWKENVKKTKAKIKQDIDNESEKLKEMNNERLNYLGSLSKIVSTRMPKSNLNVPFPLNTPKWKSPKLSKATLTFFDNLNKNASADAIKTLNQLYAESDKSIEFIPSKKEHFRYAVNVTIRNERKYSPFPTFFAKKKRTNQIKDYKISKETLEKFKRLLAKEDKTKKDISFEDLYFKYCCYNAAVFFQTLVSNTPMDEPYQYTSVDTLNQLKANKNKKTKWVKDENGVYRMAATSAEERYENSVLKSSITTREHKPDNYIVRADWILSFAGRNYKAFDSEQAPYNDPLPFITTTFNKNWFDKKGDEVAVNNIAKILIAFGKPNDKNSDVLKFNYYNVNPRWEMLEYGGYPLHTSTISHIYGGEAKYAHGISNGFTYQAPRGYVRLTEAWFNSGIKKDKNKIVMQYFLSHNKLDVANLSDDDWDLLRDSNFPIGTKKATKKEIEG